MKIILINLPFSIDSDKATSHEIRFFPEGIASIAASLTAKHDVYVVDLSKKQFNQFKFTDVDVIGLSAMINQFQALENLIPKLRRVNPQAKIILGGPLVSSDPLFIAKHLDFDFGVIGEGELTIIELLENLDHPENVPGVIFCEGNEIIINQPRKILSPKKLLMPAFQLFNPKWYLVGKKRPHFSKQKTVLNNFMISRGCPFDCKFCYRLFGKKVRYKTLAQIENELRVWYEAGMRFIRFQDDNFTLLPEKILVRIVELLKKFNFKFSCQSRIDTVNHEKLKLLKKAGLEFIYYGIESLSDQALIESGKNINVEQIKKVIEITLELDIKPAAFLIVGLPGETEESLHRMIEFVKCYKIPVTPYILCPLPGTDFFNHAKQKGKIDDELKFFRQCQNWEKDQLKEKKIYVNLTDLPDGLLLETYQNLYDLGTQTNF